MSSTHEGNVFGRTECADSECGAPYTASQRFLKSRQHAFLHLAKKKKCRQHPHEVCERLIGFLQNIFVCAKGCSQCSKKDKRRSCNMTTERSVLIPNAVHRTQRRIDSQKPSACVLVPRGKTCRQHRRAFAIGI